MWLSTAAYAASCLASSAMFAAAALLKLHTCWCCRGGADRNPAATLRKGTRPQTLMTRPRQADSPPHHHKVSTAVKGERKKRATVVELRFRYVKLISECAPPRLSAITTLLVLRRRNAAATPAGEMLHVHVHDDHCWTRPYHVTVSLQGKHFDLRMVLEDFHMSKTSHRNTKKFYLTLYDWITFVSRNVIIQQGTRTTIDFIFYFSKDTPSYDLFTGSSW